LKYLHRWPVLTALIISAIVLFFLQTFLLWESKPNFSEIDSISHRKQAFFSYLYKKVIPINQGIRLERNKLISLDKKKSLSHFDKIYLQSLAVNYKLREIELLSEINKQTITQLLIKVDVIPPAIVLAQAANESAWGTSRFAQQGIQYY